MTTAVEMILGLLWNLIADSCWPLWGKIRVLKQLYTVIRCTNNGVKQQAKRSDEVRVFCRFSFV